MWFFRECNEADCSAIIFFGQKAIISGYERPGWTRGLDLGRKDIIELARRQILRQHTWLGQYSTIFLIKLHKKSLEEHAFWGKKKTFNANKAF